MILQITVIFTSGHFHGAEWPPSPTRLFQALVAASYRGAHGLINASVRDDSLKWLEQQTPPVIFAPHSRRNLESLINYVPNNDDERGENSHVRTAKEMGAYPVAPDKPVVYQWHFTEGSQKADVICAIASMVTYLGQTVDTVFARGQLLEAMPETLTGVRWEPVEEPGGRWLSPKEGFLELLNQRYPQSASSLMHNATNTRTVRYITTPLIIDGPPVEVFEMLRPQSERRLAFAPRDLRQPVGMTRNAMVQWMQSNPEICRHFSPDQMARLIQGHQSALPSQPAQGGHFAVVPLPSINPPEYTADGWIRRVALIGYGIQNTSDQELFDEIIRGLDGATLEDNGKVRGELRICGHNGYERLFKPVFEGPKRRWLSLTPVVLTGFTRRGRSAEKCLLRCLNQQGYAAHNIETIATYSGPIIPNTDSALNYRVQGYLSTTPRVHSEIIFKNPIRGPLIVGRGRFSGLGLFIPAEEATT
jgi:CRISPR-associated protein Csb2